jgi:hypothetical protein
MEIGATYSTVLYRRAMTRLTGGITVKYLMGFAGGYAAFKNFNYIVLNDSTINVLNLDSEIGLALPVDYDNNSVDTDRLFKGNGIGFDIGITYLQTKRGYQRKKYKPICTQPHPDYFYKIGVSLLDVGFLKFKHNAQLHNFDNVSALFEEIDTINYNNINQFIGYVSEQFYGDPDASLSGSNITMFLPSALSVQLDYQFIDDWYVNGTAILPLRFSGNALHRPSQIAITPRYENRIYEIAFPVSLYDFRKPRLGVAGRIGVLTVGTDNLLGFIPIKDFTGLDIYFSVKINFNKGYCGRYSRKNPCQNQEYGLKRK